MSHVFISYVREDQSLVDRLYKELCNLGVNAWLDREEIGPGRRWRDAIRVAIEEGAFFLACFSQAYTARDRTYMNEELTIAVEQLRLRPQERAWFIPVLFNDCEVPRREIGGGQSLRDLQWVDLAADWNIGITRIADAVGREALRVLRSEDDLLDSLINHVALLREYYVKAFDNKEDRYLGEIAGKLRLLVLRKKMNMPLLLEFMEKYESEVKVQLKNPFEREPLTVDEYLDRLACFVRLEDGPVQFTNREFIETWAEQHGAAHEEPGHDRRYAASRNLPVFIYGEHSHKWHLGAVARTVLSVANSFFLELERKGVLIRGDS